MEPDRPWLAGVLFSPAFRREQPERVRELLTHFRRHRPPPQGVAAHFWASVYHDTVARLSQIQAPTLVIHGEADTMDPVPNARLLARRIPDAELAVLPDAGHAYPLEQPEVAAEVVLEWLRRRSPIAAGVPRGGLLARAEALTRPFGLHTSALRTGGSLARRVTRPRVRRAPSRPPGTPVG